MPGAPLCHPVAHWRSGPTRVADKPADVHDWLDALFADAHYEQALLLDERLNVAWFTLSIPPTC